MDTTQIDLLAWADSYKSILEMESENRPSRDIIDDDHALDLYLEDLQRKKA